MGPPPRGTIPFVGGSDAPGPFLEIEINGLPPGLFDLTNDIGRSTVCLQIIDGPLKYPAFTLFAYLVSGRGDRFSNFIF